MTDLGSFRSLRTVVASVLKDVRPVPTKRCRNGHDMVTDLDQCPLCPEPEALIHVGPVALA